MPGHFCDQRASVDYFCNPVFSLKSMVHLNLEPALPSVGEISRNLKCYPIWADRLHEIRNSLDKKLGDKFSAFLIPRLR